MNKQYRNQNQVNVQYIRTVHADQTAYRKQSNAGFYFCMLLLAIALIAVIGMLASLT